MVTVLVFCLAAIVPSFSLPISRIVHCAYGGHLLHVQKNLRASGSRTIGKSHFRLPEKLPKKTARSAAITNVPINGFND
jgi:hypothetical protein